MNDLLKAMSTDMSILRYQDETDESFTYRLCYSALVLHPLRNYTFSIGYFVSPQGGGRKRSGAPLTDDNAADGKIDNAESIVSRWMEY